MTNLDDFFNRLFCILFNCLKFGFFDLNNISGCFLIVPIDEQGESTITISYILSSLISSAFKFLIFGVKPNLNKFSFSLTTRFKPGNIIYESYW